MPRGARYDNGYTMANGYTMPMDMYIHFTCQWVHSVNGYTVSMDTRWSMDMYIHFMPMGTR